MQNVQKQRKKRTKFATLAVSVPQVSKLVNFSPYAFIFERKSQPKVLKVKNHKNYTWVSSFPKFYIPGTTYAKIES